MATSRRRTIDQLNGMPTGTIVHAIHPRWGGVGIVAIKNARFDGEPVWEVSGDAGVQTSDELVWSMGGAEFHDLTPQHYGD